MLLNVQWWKPEHKTNCSNSISKQPPWFPSATIYIYITPMYLQAVHVKLPQKQWVDSKWFKMRDREYCAIYSVCRVQAGTSARLSKTTKSIIKRESQKMTQTWGSQPLNCKEMQPWPEPVVGHLPLQPVLFLCSDEAYIQTDTFHAHYFLCKYA